jgi:hypothetical protein
LDAYCSPSSICCIMLDSCIGDFSKIVQWFSVKVRTYAVEGSENLG